jgi:hypothetical protein
VSIGCIENLNLNPLGVPGLFKDGPGLLEDASNHHQPQLDWKGCPNVLVARFGVFPTAEVEGDTDTLEISE